MLIQYKDFGMSANYETLLESDCTSCGVEQDKSAYWTPALYFMHTDGTAEMVDQVGGMLAYVIDILFCSGLWISY
jgi:hypothetical protein